MPRRAFLFAAWMSLLTAGFHLLGHFSGPRPPANDTERQIWELVSTYRYQVPGGQRTLWEFQLGFSLTFSIFLALWGLLGLLVWRHAADNLALRRSVTLASTLAALLMLAVSLRYFFVAPTACLGLVALGYVVALVSEWRVRA